MNGIPPGFVLALIVNAVIAAVAWGALYATVHGLVKRFDNWEQRGSPGEILLRGRVDGVEKMLKEEAQNWRDRIGGLGRRGLSNTARLTAVELRLGMAVSAGDEE